MSIDRHYYEWVRSAHRCERRRDWTGALRAHHEATHSCPLSQFALEAVARCCKQLGPEALRRFHGDVLRDPDACDAAKKVSRREYLRLAAGRHAKPKRPSTPGAGHSVDVPASFLRQPAASAARLRESRKPRHALAVCVTACLRQPDPNRSLREYTVAVAALTDLSQHEHAIAVLEELLPSFPTESHLSNRLGRQA